MASKKSHDGVGEACVRSQLKTCQNGPHNLGSVCNTYYHQNHASRSCTNRCGATAAVELLPHCTHATCLSRTRLALTPLTLSSPRCMQRRVHSSAPPIVSSMLVTVQGRVCLLQRDLVGLAPGAGVQHLSAPASHLAKEPRPSPPAPASPLGAGSRCFSLAAAPQ
jgi:hypothetical protein